MLAVGLFFAAQSALACPNLTGEYVNAAGDHLSVTHNGTSLQFFDDDPLLIDGQEHQVTGNFGQQIFYTGSCPNNIQLAILIVIQTAQERYEGTRTFTLTATGMLDSVRGFDSLDVNWTRR